MRIVVKIWQGGAEGPDKAHDGKAELVLLGCFACLSVAFGLMTLASLLSGRFDMSSLCEFSMSICICILFWDKWRLKRELSEARSATPLFLAEDDEEPPDLRP